VCFAPASRSALIPVSGVLVIGVAKAGAPLAATVLHVATGSSRRYCWHRGAADHGKTFAAIEPGPGAPSGPPG
jgi:hypothetical protein